jgi:HPr kinase/phosphorylase
MTTKTVHATCVAIGDRAVLLIGKSGVGKSSTALELMAYGADLVADDQVILTTDGGTVTASAPATITGLIEAYGIGVLNVKTVPTATIVMIMELDVAEEDRTPLPRTITILGCALPLFYRPKGRSLAPAILQYLRAGISDR